MGVYRTCGEPNPHDEIKKNTHPKNITALFREQARAKKEAGAKAKADKADKAKDGGKRGRSGSFRDLFSSSPKKQPGAEGNAEGDADADAGKESEAEASKPRSGSFRGLFSSSSPSR